MQPKYDIVEITQNPELASHIELLIEELPSGAFSLCKEEILDKTTDFHIFKTSSTFNIKNLLNGNRSSAIINVKRLNEYGYINKFLEELNSCLKINGLAFIVSETSLQRRKRILKKYPALINYIIYCGDYIFHRVFPKLPLTENLYYFIKGKKGRVLHEIEILGRLYSCGFEIVRKRKSKGQTYFVVRKVQSPSFEMEPTYGVFIKLRRVGKLGRTITVRKVRSMHSYSEFIQKYLYDKHGTDDGDKIIKDFRVTSWGKFIRKFWIDELPMIYNLIKGEMKIVGVRPLSAHKFSTYPEELQDLRIRTKPGLIPPFYADIPKTQEEFYKSERKYIVSYLNAPIRTDLEYFFKAVYNILFKGARSQ